MLKESLRRLLVVTFLIIGIIVKTLKVGRQGLRETTRLDTASRALELSAETTPIPAQRGGHAHELNAGRFRGEKLSMALRHDLHVLPDGAAADAVEDVNSRAVTSEERRPLAQDLDARLHLDG